MSLLAQVLPPPHDFVTLMLLPQRDDRPDLHQAWLGLPALPLPNELRGKLADLLLLIAARAGETEQRTRVLAAETYVQMAQLEQPEGPLLMSRNAMAWTPRIGLGVWPDRDPPQPLSKDDVVNTPPDQKMRQTSFHVMRIAKDAPAVDAAKTLAGTGALSILVVDKEQWTASRHEVSNHLERHITADTFKGYPMYFPMLDAASVEKLSTQSLEASLRGVVVYMREDLEQNSVFLLSRIPLAHLFAEQSSAAGQHPERL